MNAQASTLSIKKDVTSFEWRHQMINFIPLMESARDYEPEMYIRRILTFPEQLAHTLGLIILEVQKRGKVHRDDWPLTHYIANVRCEIEYEYSIEYMEHKFYLTCDHPERGRLFVQRRLREQDLHDTPTVRRQYNP